MSLVYLNWSYFDIKLVIDVQINRSGHVEAVAAEFVGFLLGIEMYDILSPAVKCINYNPLKRNPLLKHAYALFDYRKNDNFR